MNNRGAKSLLCAGCALCMGALYAVLAPLGCGGGCADAADCGVGGGGGSAGIVGQGGRDAGTGAVGTGGNAGAGAGAGGSGGESGTGGTGGDPPDSGGGICGGIANIKCAETMYCDYRGDMCGGGESNPGTCQPRPATCSRDCPGACGCDGMFYCNVCEGQRAGTDAVTGPCPDASNLRRPR
jgi:hypothetical protein